MRGGNSAKFWLFLVGLWSATQIHFMGSIGISELVLFALTPWFLIQDYKNLKQDGFLPVVWLIIFVCIGGVLSALVNRGHWFLLLKSVAFPYSHLAGLLFLHRYLRRDLSGFKWYVFGEFLSSIISIFIFQPETFTVQQGEVFKGAEAVEAVVGNPLFWPSKISALMRLPVNLVYVSLPTWASVLFVLPSVLISLFLSKTSGRSAALVGLLGIILMALGGRSRKNISRVGKNIFLIIGIGMVGVAGFKVAYSYLAKSGALGAEALEKYERQTAMGDSALRLLMAGRMELFCGVMACMDQPIFGFGPKAEDTHGYAEAFLAKYGDDDDYDHYVQMTKSYYKATGRAPGIPSHSSIGYYWINFGIIGLIYWLYVFWLMFMYLRRYAPAIPQLYGILTATIASQAWHILFSPPHRMNVAAFLAYMLFCRAVYQGKIRLPWKMEMEAQNAG